MLLLGETFDATTALDAGIVTRVVPAERALDAAHEAAAKLALLPPDAVRLTKALLKAAHRSAIDQQMAAEGRHFRALLSAPAAQQALQAFLAKRV
jgi:enoyl-CoA hydratase/carnithine racemase